MGRIINIDRSLASWLTMRLKVYENSQNVANNTTSLSVDVQLISGNGNINSTASKDIELTINGTKYTSTCSVGIEKNTTKTLFTKTVTVPHNTDGSKTVALSCLLTFDVTISGTWWGDRSLSGNVELTDIPRLSTLTSSAYRELGTGLTLSVEKKASSFTHTITYTCGSASGTIATKSSSTSLSFTPPLSLASQNTTGTSVSIKFTITTYNGSTNLGSTTHTISCSIPSSVKPSCKITVSDAAGYSVYIKGLSKFKITVTPALAYGSDIESYSVKANGGTYTTAAVTTSVLSSSGTLTIEATVKDKRGRSATASVSVNVFDKSTFTVNNGTLGLSQNITVAKGNSNFTHTLAYTCGSVSNTLATKSNSTSIAFNPPLDLAKQNTTGTTVSVKLTLTTYCDDKNIGTETKTITCSIPESVKPSVYINFADSTDNFTEYGSYVKGLSQLYVWLGSSASYGSDIVSYSTTVNGTKHTTAAFECGVISSNSIEIEATVTDKRGRTGTAKATVSNIIDYIVPNISQFLVRRCDSSGAANDKGDHAQVVYSADVTPLNNKNAASYSVQFKKTTDKNYTQGETVSGVYSISDRSFIFAADTGASYDILLTVQDSHSTSSRTTVVSTGFVLLHFGADGKSIGIGKIAELTETLDIGLQTLFTGGIVPVILDNGTDFNILTTPNLYRLYSAGAYANNPADGFGAVLEVLVGDGSCTQRITTISKTNPHIWVRSFYDSSWGEWVLIYPSKVTWNNLTLAENISVANNNTPQCCVTNKTVECKGAVSFTTRAATSDGATLLFTLPVGHRPPNSVYLLVPLTGYAVARLLIRTNGEVLVEWVYSLNQGKELFSTSLSWLSVDFSFAIG